MNKRKAPGEESRQRLLEKMIKGEYTEYLESHHLNRSPDSAQLFAIEKIGGGHDYMGFKERQLILLLEGALPPMFD